MTVIFDLVVAGLVFLDLYFVRDESGSGLGLELSRGQRN